ncbi:OmpH family outer membrane protein [Aeromonas simiae]|uniref:OmpH family outer membrane protein n=1 Tax=Aeromonas simiae TaxID=218936 RepID=A0A5J6WZV6_9GAMM|nr:OmpH family outer membrane protein [Aeromonas simiae]MDO2946999.1 OmpH family outer membrane protein [Aeromonas simiae]MDO2950611.1 OmpH family outer membrane protein [Aeromonas simiae]MDO2954407.1 OmpH family outer membrane protein [Aeromonas simiae]QFI55283.1 hypothetical protein FE240_11680 [Aeromonas simiae]
MKKVVKVAGLTLALMTAGMGSAMADTKIGVVDMEQVFQRLPQREQVSAQLKREFEPRVRELQKLEQEGQKLVEKFQKDEAFMSKDQKKQNQEKLAKLQMEFNQKRQSFEQDNARRQGEERAKILKQVKSAIDQIARDGGYDLILENNATPYSSSKMDITSQVISKVGK